MHTLYILLFAAPSWKTIVIVLVIVAFYLLHHPWYVLLPNPFKTRPKLKISTNNYFDELERVRWLIDDSVSARDFQISYMEVMDFRDHYKGDWELLYRHWCEHFVQKLKKLMDKALSDTPPVSKSSPAHCYEKELFALFDSVVDHLGNTELDTLAKVAQDYNLNIISRQSA